MRPIPRFSRGSRPNLRGPGLDRRSAARRDGAQIGAQARGGTEPRSALKPARDGAQIGAQPRSGESTALRAI